jgi:hypothetical protein
MILFRRLLTVRLSLWKRSYDRRWAGVDEDEDGKNEGKLSKKENKRLNYPATMKCETCRNSVREREKMTEIGDKDQG